MTEEPLGDYELKVLEEVARPGSHPDLVWGAALSMALETLHKRGFVLPGLKTRVTRAGKEYLIANATRKILKVHDGGGSAVIYMWGDDQIDPNEVVWVKVKWPDGKEERFRTSIVDGRLFVVVVHCGFWLKVDIETIAPAVTDIELGD